MFTLNQDVHPLAQEPAPISGHRSATLSFQQQTSMTRDQLYESFAPLVKRLIHQYGTTADLRQDLAGEIFCCFCHVVEAYDPERGVPLRPYIVRQLTSAVYAYSRQQWQVRKHEVVLDATESNETLPSVDPTPSWLKALSDQQVVESLAKVIAQLPGRQQQVVIWRYHEGRSFEEIAELLHVQASTVRSLLRHGLNSIRKVIVPVDCDDSQ